MIVSDEQLLLTRALLAQFERAAEALDLAIATASNTKLAQLQADATRALAIDLASEIDQYETAGR